MDKSQLAELSFVISLLFINNNSNELTSRSMDPTLRSCLATAVGIGAIRDLISNTAALGTVETAVSAIRLIGRRYLGWIGVGLMVLDFMDCYYGITNQ